MVYEFTDKDARIMSAVGSKFQWFGLMMIVLGTASLLFPWVFSGPGDLLPKILDTLRSLAGVLVGVLLYRPSDNLKNIFSTEGRDIPELMTAIKELRLAFTLCAVLFASITLLFIINRLVPGAVYQ